MCNISNVYHYRASSDHTHRSTVSNALSSIFLLDHLQRQLYNIIYQYIMGNIITHFSTR